MSEFRADLHCHTSCSDGSLTPEELIKKAAEIGLKGLSITDHDTIEAYKSAFPAAKLYGIDLITGIEFSCTLRKTSIHILGYSFDLDSPGIKTLCEKHCNRRHERNRTILKLLTKHGMPLSDEDLYMSSGKKSGESIGRPHIALAMVKKGYVENINEAFKKYLREDRPCYSPGESYNVKETIDVIHSANGFAVIAHPHLLNDQNIVRDLLEMEFDGLECYYARFPSHEQERWVRKAKKKELLITGGSDFHGDFKPNNPLGCSWVNEEIFRKLKHNDQSNEL